MVKYRFPGIAGSSLLWLGSSIGFYSGCEFLTGAEGDHAPGGDGYFFAGLGIATGPLALVAQVEVAETRQLHLLVVFQRVADLFKKQFHQFLGFTLVETKLLVEMFRHFCFCQSPHTHFPIFSRWHLSPARVNPVPFPWWRSLRHQ